MSIIKRKDARRQNWKKTMRRDYFQQDVDVYYKNNGIWNCWLPYFLCSLTISQDTCHGSQRPQIPGTSSQHALQQDACM
jgi:hypothetical protein